MTFSHFLLYAKLKKFNSNNLWADAQVFLAKHCMVVVGICSSLYEFFCKSKMVYCKVGVKYMQCNQTANSLCQLPLHLPLQHYPEQPLSFLYVMLLLIFNLYPGPNSETKRPVSKLRIIICGPCICSWK